MSILKTAWSWIQAHKVQIGFALTVIAGWADAQDCGTIFTIDVSQIFGRWCAAIGSVALWLSGVVTGGGIMKSDQYYKDRRAEQATADRLGR